MGIIDEYKDVFPKELRHGLPAKVLDEMSTDLEKDTKPKMGPIYKLPRKELEETKNKLRRPYP